jgi:hypothetical protein
MARSIADKKIRMPESASPKRKRISAKNRAAIKLLDEWMSTPDDMGEEFWIEFEKELKHFTMHGEG